MCSPEIFTDSGQLTLYVIMMMHCYLKYSSNQLKTAMTIVFR